MVRKAANKRGSAKTARGNSLQELWTNGFVPTARFGQNSSRDGHYRGSRSLRSLPEATERGHYAVESNRVRRGTSATVSDAGHVRVMVTKRPRPPLTGIPTPVLPFTEGAWLAWVVVTLPAADPASRGSR